MHRYTIPQILALFLGVLSVVARSLPERRSDIDVPSPGDVNDPKQHPEVLDLVGNIHTTTYSMSNNYTPLPKRDTALEKRLDIQGAPCQTTCVEPNSDNPSSHPNPDDCAELYKINRSVTGTFTAEPGQNYDGVYGACDLTFVNSRSDTAFTYDWWDFAGTAEWLTGECIIRQNMNYGVCIFEDTGVAKPPYVRVARVGIPKL